MVKVVTGARRCGKSYLLFRLFIRYLKKNDIDDAHIVALALDDDENAAYRNPEQLGLYLRSRIVDEEATYYVLLDEIQYAISDDELRDRSNPPRLYGILNGLLRRRNVDVYVTGSNSKLLSTDVMTEFRDVVTKYACAPCHSLSLCLPTRGSCQCVARLRVLEVCPLHFLWARMNSACTICEISLTRRTSRISSRGIT
jgi:predicted AAA+ superfamily ATPase